MNATTGAGNWLSASATVADGKVFIRNGFRLNYALNATTGDIMWTYDGRYNIGTPGQLGGVVQYMPMLYKYGFVYFNDFYGITCLNATDGKEFWHSYRSRENLASWSSYGYQRIYTVTEFGSLYVLDALTGDTLSYYDFNPASQMRSMPVPYNGSLYIGTFDGSLYCFGEAPAVQVAGPAMATTTTVTVTPNSQILGRQVAFGGMVEAQSTGIPVKVHLTAIDPNDNYQDIATPTCDESGFYTAKWTPPVPGAYVVTAKFEGDQYFSASSAKAMFVVSDPAATQATVSVDEIVRRVIAAFPSIPAGVSADEVAQKVVANLPANPTADQIAQAISNQLSAKPASVPAEYTIAAIIIILVAVIAAVARITGVYLIRKRK